MLTETDIDINQIDDVIHGRLRLGIMAYLSAVNPASFGDILKKTGSEPHSDENVR